MGLSLGQTASMGCYYTGMAEVLRKQEQRYKELELLQSMANATVNNEINKMFMSDSQPLFSASHVYPKPWERATRLTDTPMLGVPEFHALKPKGIFDSFKIAVDPAVDDDSMFFMYPGQIMRMNANGPMTFTSTGSS